MSDTREEAMSVLVTDYYPRPMATARRATDRRVPAQPSRAPRTAEAARHPGLRLTRRGRAVVSLLAVLAGAAVTFASQQAVAGEGGGAVPVNTRTVVAGETLWQIAGEYARPGQDVRDVVDELMELNGFHTGELRAGQEVLVPAP